MDRSLSAAADSDLHSAYENLRKGEYKICKRIIDKRMPKLKSEIDKMNFNIVKLLLMDKLKKTKETKILAETLKKEVLSNPNLSNNSELCGYFKNVLIELNEEQAAAEIFKNSIKSLNLTKIARKDQSMILKELTISYEFQELYAKISQFLKNENDPDINFLTLLKYEVIYILSFKYQKLSKTIANLTLKDMLKNYNNLHKEKGFIDILVKYLISMNDTENFLNLFENKQIEFTNAPIEDLIVDIYFKKEDSIKLINFIIIIIRNNLNECNFNYYLRLINYIFHLFQKNSLLSKIDLDLIFKYFSDNFNQNDNSFYETFTIENLEDINSTFSNILIFFEYIRNVIADKKTNFNGYKSSLLAKLTIYHNLVITTGSVTNLLNEEIYSHILHILRNSVHKQSILTEINKFFIYLSVEQRNQILKEFSFKVEEIDNLSENDKEDVLFYFKLEKMLNQDKIANSDELNRIINKLTNIYFSLTNNSNKLEKGERLTGDDILILVNEYFFEFVNNNKNINSSNDEIFRNLSFNLYCINSIASERSPYNYDISLFYLRTASFLNLPQKVLEILKFMNLKGPQYETVSYIAFPCFFNNFYKPGLFFLIDSFETWEYNNKKSIRKTFWKMFTGRNFWNTDELLEFQTENENSYFKHLLNYLDVTISLNENLVHTYEDEDLRKESLLDLVDLMNTNFIKYEDLLINKKLSRNQDLLISIFKFKQIPYFDNNLNLVKKNRNYNEKNFKYVIDSLWKDNIIYENYPSFKNNFFLQDDIQVFNIFDDENLLTILNNNRILSTIIYEEKISQNLNFSLKEAFEKYTNSLKITEIKNEEINQYENIFRNLSETYVNSLNNIETLTNEIENIEKNNTFLKEKFVEKSQNMRLNYDNHNFSHNFEFIKHFQIFKNFYLSNFTYLTGKFINLINDNKKQIKDAAALKVRFTNSFKSPFLNFFIDTALNLEVILKKVNHDETMNFFFKSLSTLDEEIFKRISDYKVSIIQLSRGYSDEQKDQLKSLIESSKSFKNFIKENI